MKDYLTVSDNDAFERIYMQEFRSRYAHFGEFVNYERDRAGRDLGMQLVRRRGSEEVVTQALCWFQMKGIKASTLSAPAAAKLDTFPVPLEVKHLRFYFLASDQTYLCLYIEALSQFYILNLKKYVTRSFGTEILVDRRRKITVPVPKSSVLDDQAFNLILNESDVQSIQEAFATSSDDASMQTRDHALIRKIATRNQRKVQQRLLIRDWISKARLELYFQERPSNKPSAEWIDIRSHWQFMLQPEEFSRMYPYLDFHASTSASDDLDDGERAAGDAEIDDHTFQLPNGQDVIPEIGPYGEPLLYTVYFELNELGRNLLTQQEYLLKAGIIVPSDTTSIDVAPWHHRDV